MEANMKRKILATLIVLGCIGSAHADQDFWTDVRKPARVNDTLQQDTDFCTQTVGPSRNGEATPAVFKRCMGSRGWRYAGTKREHTWVDEDGLTCFNRGGATHCSNH
jgi:hypothetical protein